MFVFLHRNSNIEVKLWYSASLDDSMMQEIVEMLKSVFRPAVKSFFLAVRFSAVHGSANTAVQWKIVKHFLIVCFQKSCCGACARSPLMFLQFDHAVS